MENEANIESDVSSELPDLYVKKPFVIEKLQPNDIVWAEFRDLHWPALVRHVDKKNRKIRLWYLDTPKKTFKLPFRKIRDFSDREVNKEVSEKAKSSPFAQTHYEVCRRSLMFIMRRDRGLDDNPADFFDKSKPYFMLKAFYSENPDFDLTSKDPPTESVNEIVEDLEKSSDGESLEESDEESFKKREILLDLYKEDRIYSDEMEDKILNFIKSGSVDDHLMDVWNSKIASEKHDLYWKALNTKDMKLLTNSPPYIPLSNCDKMQNINLYLYGLYEQNIGKDKPKMNEYIVSVWLPEAVDRAISLINSGSSQDNGNLDSCSLSDLPEPTLRIPVSHNNNNLPNRAKTSKPSIQRMKKISKSLVTEVNTLKDKTRYLNRRFPNGAPPAMQALADNVDGLEASIQDLQSHIVKKSKAVLGSESSDDTTGSNKPANRNIRRKRQKKSVQPAEKRISLRLQLKEK